MIRKKLVINGVARDLVLDGSETLAKLLRERLLLTGCKIGCGEGHCGACNVIVDGKVTRSCVTKVTRLKDNAEITTIEGIGTLHDMHPLQVAWMANGCAQCGFCAPGFIMSGIALLNGNCSPTRKEVRDWFDKNRNLCRCAGYKPMIDAVMDAAKVMRGELTKEDLVFKPEGDSIKGTRYIRPSAAQKVTGSWDFGADDALKLPEGTLRLALTQAKVSHANIKGIDTSEAEKMPGVFKVITYKDILEAGGTNQINGLVMLPKHNKNDGFDRPVLCRDKIFQFGDAIAIVAAETEEQARAAAEAVKVDIEELPAYMNAIDAMAPDAIEIHPGTPNVFFETNCIKGGDFDWDSIPDSQQVEIESYCSRQPHLHLEPDCGYAYIDEDGMLTIHSKSIGIHLHMPMIAGGIGVPMEKLRMIQNHAGGTFGYKFSPTNEAILGAAALICKRPVSLVFNMYQNITYTGKRSPAFMHVKLAADEKGKLLALWGDNFIDHGPYSEFGDLLTMRLSQFTGAGYGIGSIRNRSRTVFTNHAWGSAFRAYGSPQAFIATEVLVDELAEKLGMDPLDLREVNVLRPGDTFPTGQAPEVYPFPKMVEMIRPKYTEAVQRAKNNSTETVKRGVGLALGVYGCGLDGPDSSAACAELTPAGVTIYNAWEDHGQGADAGTVGTASKALAPLNLKPCQIHTVMNDTALTPNSGPAGGSRSQVMTGNAVRVACGMLVAAMKKPDGTYRTYDEMVAEKLPLKYEGTWGATMCKACDENGQGAPFPIYMYGLFMAEVAVDVTTGKTVVEKLTMIADVGRVVNRDIVDGQLYGGMIQGLGLALSEDFEDIQKQTSLAACGIPYIKDAPDNMELHYIESDREDGPFGAAGCGEAPLTAPHPAIINAIYNACGARVTKLPAYPEKVLEALKEKQSGCC